MYIVIYTIISMVYIYIGTYVHCYIYNHIYGIYIGTYVHCYIYCFSLIGKIEAVKIN